MADSDNNPNGPAISKRIKISKTQQETLLIVLIAAVVLGICGVLAVYFGKYIGFNSKVIEAKDSAIADYEKTIQNIGLCKDSDRDGKFSDEEIRKCNPDTLDSNSMPGSLRYNVMVNMANNTDLESVARDSQKDCYDSAGDKIDWQEKFDDTENDEEKARYLSMLKMCSALRVVPDALPAQANEEALMSSLNQIFNISAWDPEALSPSGNVVSSTEGLSTIPVSLSVESKSDVTTTVLNNIERSIRTFDLQTATVSWSGNDSLSLQSQGVAYYTEDADVVETTKTVYATNDAKKKTSQTSSSGSK
ncbi:hypothetical protein IKE84_00740 [Candidatus Saccharibacteria bacterium]|nr:hypothetical protein [Candidatus Saccharibacteria bacterium]